MCTLIVFRMVVHVLLYGLFMVVIIFSFVSIGRGIG